MEIKYDGVVAASLNEIEIHRDCVGTGGITGSSS